MHGETAIFSAKIRSRFWIPKDHRLVKIIIKHCIVCKKYLSKHADQITAPLPKDRVNATIFSLWFRFCRSDLFKNFKDTQDSYIVIFTCGVTRHLHLELVSDMTTNTLLLAFRRSTARRINCNVIYFDKVKTFKKAKRKLEIWSHVMSERTFFKILSRKRVGRLL